ncbi:MAG TPA: ImmA/IrrE family metallo-endopeptidase [Ruminococcus sp.]|nr:ImmA/IrrE family metallo-endopeptidase [Ruminococcus sp.]
MTTTFQASIRYPLIWIINTANPDEPELRYNKVHHRLKKMVRFTDWLRAHYETAYHYYLAEHLHEYGLGTGDISDFVGLRVTGAQTLNTILYRKSWSEVYVDMIIRVYVDIYTGNEYAPVRRKSVVDYRVRGYYDLYEKRNSLFQCFMPYHPEDDMDRSFGKLRLDDYLVPNIDRNCLEDLAHWFLEEHYPAAFAAPGHINIKAMIREMGLHAYKTGLSTDGSKKGALFLYERNAIFYTEKGLPVFKKVPPKTILIDRSLCRDNICKANNTAMHECTHFGLHSLFFLFQENYIRELHEYFEPIEEEYLPLDEDDLKEISKMEWQANRLAPRILMLDDWVDEKMQKILPKYAWMNEFAMYEAIIKEIAEYFKVSKEAAKYRLRELNYSDTSGILNFINEAYIPAYKVPSGISPYQTFDISQDELVKVFRTDHKLRRLLHTGDYIYCEGHLCLNAPPYIERSKDGNPMLTRYAHEHMIECCLLFTKRRILIYDYKTGVLQDTIPEQFQKAFLSGTPAQKTRWKKLVSETKKALPSNFNDIVAYYMENWAVSVRQVADLSGLSNGVISKCKTNRNYRPSIPIAAMLTLGLGLVPGLNDHLMHKAGHMLDGDTDEEIVFDIILSTMYADTIDKWDEFVREQGLPALLREKQSGVK